MCELSEVTCSCSSRGAAASASFQNARITTLYLRLSLVPRLAQRALAFEVLLALVLLKYRIYLCQQQLAFRREFVKISLAVLGVGLDIDQQVPRPSPSIFFSQGS